MWNPDYAEQHRARIRQRSLEKRLLRDCLNPFTEEPEYFRSLYRCYPEVAYRISNLIAPQLVGSGSTSLKVHVKFLSALRLFASDSYQKDISLIYTHPSSQPSVSRAFDLVVNALVSLGPRLIQFPNTRARRAAVAQSYDETIRIPSILGLLDCFVVKILKPTENEEAFVHHKHSHSLNVQAISDRNHYIYNLRVCSGSTPDKFIWLHSEVKRYLESLAADEHINETEGRYYIIGDSGYGPSQILLTPYVRAPRYTPEWYYTKEHQRSRCSVETTFGALTGTIRILKRERGMRYVPEKAANIVTAGVCLHNLILRHGFLIPEADPNDVFNETNDRVEKTYIGGVLERIDLINHYYR